MKNLLKTLGVVASLGLGINSFAQDPSAFKNDSIVKEYSTVTEIKSIGDSVFGTREYEIEKISHYRDSKIQLETISKFNIEEKTLDLSKGPGNLRESIQTDKFLESISVKKHSYDTLGRKTEIAIKENNSPAGGILEERKILHSYEGECENPREILYDNDNNGEFSAGDSREIYVPKLDQWISEEFPKEN